MTSSLSLLGGCLQSASVALKRRANRIRCNFSSGVASIKPSTFSSCADRHVRPCCCETGRFLNSRPLSTRRPVTESYHSRITETKKASHMSKKRIWIADELLRQFQGCKDVSKVWRTRSTGVSHTGPFSPIPLDVGVCLRADCAPNESLKPLPGPKTFPMDSLLPSMLARYLQ
jgi:hypothetical protein